MIKEKNKAKNEEKNDTDKCTKRRKERSRLHLKDYFPIWTVVLLSLAIASVVIFALCILNRDFADFFNFRIAAYYRMFMAWLTAGLPFSLAELIIYFVPVFIVIFIASVIRFTRKEEYRKVARTFICVVAILSFFFTSFVFSHGSGYRGSTLDEVLDIDRQNVSVDELKNAAEYLSEKLTQTSEDIEFKYGSFSVMPYSFDEMVDKINIAYSKVCLEYDFLLDFHSSVKPVMSSEAMSYMGILGVYSYYSGESNVNIAFPEYTLPYTCAHEMSHQKGISREDEANYMAYIVCMASDDSYIRYSGYLNMFEYVMNALYKVDKSSYSQMYWSVGDKIVCELQAYNSFVSKYEDTVIADVSEKINNSYLVANGQSSGTKSYGLVVDLFVASQRIAIPEPEEASA